MAMVVKNNIDALNTLNTLNKNSEALTSDLAKVSSGLKINGAADDASGYAISERMRTQIRSLEQDNVNAQNGSSMIKVAEGALQSSVEVLRTMKERALNAANDTNTDDDRATIQKELDQSIDQLDENALVTYNGQFLIDGSHNSKVQDGGCQTVMANNSLNSGVDASTEFINMTDKNGNSLNISTNMTLTISFVKEGITYESTCSITPGLSFSALDDATDWLPDANFPSYFGAVSGNPQWMTIGSSSSGYIGTDQVGDPVYTPEKSGVLTVAAKDPGLNGAISGFTVCITDHTGHPVKYANALLDAFKEAIPAQDQSDDNAISLQIGTKANQSIRIGLMDMRTRALGLRGKDGYSLNIGTREMANAAVNVLDNALTKALNQQTTIGAMESRLEFTSSNITASSENTQAAESVIRDADMAKAMTSYTKNNVLLQSAQSMLSQANQNSSSVLSLLQ
jgi:flagellin